MQFDVHENPDSSAEYAPLLLDIQADLLSDLDTRVVVPLILAGKFGRPASRLHPRLTVSGWDLVMATHLIAAIRRSGLGRRVTSLADQGEILIAAVDVLVSGV